MIHLTDSNELIPATSVSGERGDQTPIKKSSKPKPETPNTAESMLTPKPSPKMRNKLHVQRDTGNQFQSFSNIIIIDSNLETLKPSQAVYRRINFEGNSQSPSMDKRGKIKAIDAKIICRLALQDECLENSQGKCRNQEQFESKQEQKRTYLMQNISNFEKPNSQQKRLNPKELQTPKRKSKVRDRESIGRAAKKENPFRDLV